MKLSRIALAATAFLATSPLAAAPSRLTVPLSDPAKPATLEVSLVMGSVHVVAGKAGEVVLEASAARDDQGQDDAMAPAIAGRTSDRADREHPHMHKIPNATLDLTADEDHNRVRVSTSSFMHALDLEIQVPPESSLKLSTVNDGDIEVAGVGGDLDLHNTNGDIRVEDARGPVTATTVNGDVKVVFSGQMAAAPMAFSTLNGDVDLTLPPTAKANVRLRSDNGDIYSDFDVALSPAPAKIEQDQAKGKYRVSIAKELTGTIAGGGPELFLKTFNGDILLRKAGGGH